LILAKCISGVRLDSNDYRYGWSQAVSDFYNPVKGINNERTTCAAGSRRDADRYQNYTTPDYTCPDPIPSYVSYCKGYHEAYGFNWNGTNTWSQLHPIKPAVDQRDEIRLSNIVLNTLGNLQAMDPNDVLALIDKAVALDKLGDHAEALDYIGKALVIDPKNTYALNKAVALNNLGNYTGAILYYNKTLAIDPKNTFALTNKAAILDRLGNNTSLDV
jgi:tetratricopeptide (TPR) repeat protein